MANATTGNKIYVEATGALATTRKKVAYIIFTPDAANDEIIIKETSAGDTCLHLRGATAKQSLLFDFSNKPLVFQNGIYVSTLTSSAKAVLITTESGE